MAGAKSKTRACINLLNAWIIGIQGATATSPVQPCRLWDTAAFQELGSKRGIAPENLYCRGLLMYSWQYAWELFFCTRAHKIYKGGRSLRAMMLREGTKPREQLEDCRGCPVGMLALQPRTTPANANVTTGSVAGCACICATFSVRTDRSPVRTC